tara:strand:- start:56 stop:943 length:888 start_codon:yes stop_codon:yes gene_type:complete
MNNKKIYILEDRGILFIQGPDTKEFLQNLITNDINKVNEKNSCFASLLTPQGKYLFDFLIVQHKNGYFLDCEKKQIEDLYKQLMIYKLRSNIEILNLSNEFIIAALSYEKFMSFDGAEDLLGSTTKHSEDPIFLDPRHKKLGGRLIINLEKLNLSLKKLELEPFNIEEYYQLSHKFGVPQKHTDKLRNKIFGIECNFEELNCIDFKKGCYIGQENTSRIKLRNKLSNRLLPVELISGNLIEGASIFNNSDEIGKILINDQYPFASVKYLSKNFNTKITYKSENAILKINFPNWIK